MNTGQSEAVKSAHNLILDGEETITKGEFLFKIRDKPWIYSPLMARLFLRSAAESKNKENEERAMNQTEEEEY